MLYTGTADLWFQPCLILQSMFWPALSYSCAFSLHPLRYMVLPHCDRDKAPPCSSFSFTMVNESHAVLFGGFHSGSGWTNDVYMLDLSRMVSCVELTWN